MTVRLSRPLQALVVAAGAAVILFASPVHCGALSERSNPDFTCKLRHKTTNIDSLRRYPPGIRAFLKKQYEPMADRGQPFNDTDVVTHPAPFARFIRGGKTGPYWFLWYEHGGIAYWKKVEVLEVSRGGKMGAVANAMVNTGSLCAATDHLLDGLR
jgi:hypothetical protein